MFFIERVLERIAYFRKHCPVPVKDCVGCGLISLSGFQYFIATKTCSKERYYTHGKVLREHTFLEVGFLGQSAGAFITLLPCGEPVRMEMLGPTPGDLTQQFWGRGPSMWIL